VVSKGKENFQEQVWVKIVDKRDEAWPMVPKCTFKQCHGKVDKMRKTYNKMWQTHTCARACKWVWFVRIVKASGAPIAYDDGSQTTPKGASTLHLMDIGDEDTTHEEPKSLLCQHNMDASTFEVPKNLDIPLISTCKKYGVDEKPNKQCRRNSDSSSLAFTFFQFVKSSNKIETMKMEGW